MVSRWRRTLLGWSRPDGFLYFFQPFIRYPCRTLIQALIIGATMTVLATIFG